MQEAPQQFTSTKQPQPLNPDDKTDPNNPLSATFAKLLEQEDKMAAYRVFKNAIIQRELLAQWAVIESKNARNCAEWVHGVPFLRLARFGFFSQPSPGDLGSILNCNALYTFKGA